MAGETEREKVKMSSLDEAFHANMRAILDGPATGDPAAAPPAVPAPAARDLLAILVDRYGLVAIDPAQARATEARKGGLLASIGRKLFATRGYHSALYTLIDALERAGRDSAARERAAADRWNRFVEKQAALNEKLARTLFHLWGDYNHLVSVVLDHQINAVIPNLQERMARADRLEEELRGFEARASEKLVEIVGCLRGVEGGLNEVRGPHDEMERNVADLVSLAPRFEVLAAKLEDLERRLSKVESAPAAAAAEGKGV